MIISIFLFTILVIAIIPLSQVIKRFIMHAKKTAFVVEHDFIMATYLADRYVRAVRLFVSYEHDIIQALQNLRRMSLTTYLYISHTYSPFVSIFLYLALSLTISLFLCLS